MRTRILGSHCQESGRRKRRGCGGEADCGGGLRFTQPGRYRDFRCSGESRRVRVPHELPICLDIKEFEAAMHGSSGIRKANSLKVEADGRLESAP